MVVVVPTLGLDGGGEPAEADLNWVRGDSVLRARLVYGLCVVGPHRRGLLAQHAALREGPETHGGKDYWLSTEVTTGKDVAAILSRVLETEVTCVLQGPDDLAAYVDTIGSAGIRLYMESAVQKMRQSGAGKINREATVRDDVQTVLGRPGITLEEWARKALRPAV
ncbi:hypothetical protein ACPF8X_01585 [Streptomyces sp. G35A]